jgi:hypothetical protein
VQLETIPRRTGAWRDSDSCLIVFVCIVLSVTTAMGEESRFIDNSLLVSPEYPCTWPSYPFPRFQITHQ